MSTHFSSFELHHLLGDSATYPIEPLAARLGSKTLLAGSSPDFWRLVVWQTHRNIAMGEPVFGARHQIAGFFEFCAQCVPLGWFCAD